VNYILQILQEGPEKLGDLKNRFKKFKLLEASKENFIQKLYYGDFS